MDVITAFLSEVGFLLLCLSGFLWPVGVLLLWLWGLRQIARRADLDGFIELMYICGLFCLILIPLVCLVGSSLHHLLYRDQSLARELGEAVLLALLGMLVAWFFGFGIFSVQLNMILCRYFREGRTLEQPEVGSQVRWWVRRWIRLHRWLFRRRGLSVDEVLDRVVPQTPR